MDLIGMLHQRYFFPTAVVLVYKTFFALKLNTFSSLSVQDRSETPKRTVKKKTAPLLVKHFLICHWQFLVLGMFRFWMILQEN